MGPGYDFSQLQFQHGVSGTKEVGKGLFQPP